MGSAANAATASTDDFVPQGGAGAGGTLSVTLNASYAANDSVVLSLVGGTFRTGTTSTDASMTCAATATTSTLLLGFVSKTANAITFRVTGGTGLEKTGFSCGIPVTGLSITRNSVTSTGTTGVQLSQSSYIGGGSTAFDAQADGTQVARSYAQFSVSAVSALSGTVSVAANRLAWTGTTGNTAKSVTLTLSGLATDVASGTTLGLADSSIVTASGALYGANAATPMFAWLDDDQNGCTADDITAGPGSASITSGGSLSISANCATLSYSFPAAVGATGTTSRNVAITLAKASASTGLAIQQGSFSVSTVFTVSNASSASQAAIVNSAGAFGIDGAIVNIPYMPYGNTGGVLISQAYYITNTSATAGTVTGTARNQAGVLCNLGSVGVAAAQATTNISTGINSAIAGCYGTGGVVADGTRVYIDLISNTAQANTVVNATYSVGGNRVQVVNDSMQIRNLKADGTLN